MKTESERCSFHTDVYQLRGLTFFYQIETLQERIETREQKQQKLQIEIQTIKEMWLPALETLISNIGDKFSAAFESMLVNSAPIGNLY